MKTYVTHKTLTKIFGIISISPIVLGFMNFELSESLWIILFFGGLAFAILFHALDEKEEEIKMLYSPKEDSEEWKKLREKRQKIEEAYPYSDDPFPPSDTLSPIQSLALKETREITKTKETKLSQNQNTKDSKKEYMNAHKIPKGLHKCEKCGEYKGRVLEKDGKDIFISCICKGILCPKCKKNKIHKPTYNYYDEESDSIWHSPYFAGQFGCAECQKKKNN